jgi:hypothetical protein
MKKDENAPRLFASDFFLAIGACGIAIFLIAYFRLRKRPVAEIPNSLGPPVFDPRSIPSLASVGLASETIEEFVRWVAAVPISEAQLVRDQIAVARGNEHIAESLVARLFQLPVPDFGRHLLLLSILGELRDSRSVEPLLKFINLPPDSLFAQTPDRQGQGPATSYLDYSAALQARAAEMLAFIRTPEALDKVLVVAFEHSSRAVRLAALDSFIFNHDDSPEAVDKARTAARPEEAKFVGLARRERDFNPRDFDSKVRAFYQRYPEECPPSPAFSVRRALNEPQAGPPRERSR